MEARQREGARTSEEAKAREEALAEELETRGKVLARVEAQVVTASPPQTGLGSVDIGVSVQWGTLAGKCRA